MNRVKLDYTVKFKRNFKTRILPNHLILELFHDAIDLFLENPFNPYLRTHLLKGSMKKFYAFSINEDHRVIFRFHKDKVLFYDIGKHSQIYKK